ncbi:hypothetical protein STEG23_027155, partial [Scotinomys teguina]
VNNSLKSDILDQSVFVFDILATNKPHLEVLFSAQTFVPPNALRSVLPDKTLLSVKKIGTTLRSALSYGKVFPTLSPRYFQYQCCFLILFQINAVFSSGIKCFTVQPHSDDREKREGKGGEEGGSKGKEGKEEEGVWKKSGYGLWVELVTNRMRMKKVLKLKV